MTYPKQISQDFVVVSPDKVASTESLDPELYTRIDETYNGFIGHELVSCYQFDSDWESWEMHPHGDEVVILMSGAVRFVLQEGDGQTFIEMVEQGQYVVVPKGVWHTARTESHSKLLFITPGQDTQHKPI